MIPCLYDSREMKFDNNGIGKLADAQSCTVTEKRNGSYELKLICPADGIHAEMLEEGNVILAKPEKPCGFRLSVLSLDRCGIQCDVYCVRSGIFP